MKEALKVGWKLELWSMMYFLDINTCTILASTTFPPFTIRNDGVPTSNKFHTVAEAPLQGNKHWFRPRRCPNFTALGILEWLMEMSLNF